MAGPILALTRPAVFLPKAAKICRRISQHIRVESTRFIAERCQPASWPNTCEQGAAVTRTSGDGSTIGRRNSQRLRCYADLPIPQSNSSWAAIMRRLKENGVAARYTFSFARRSGSSAPFS